MNPKSQKLKKYAWNKIRKLCIEISVNLISRVLVQIIFKDTNEPERY